MTPISIQDNYRFYTIYLFWIHLLAIVTRIYRSEY